MVEHVSSFFFFLVFNFSLRIFSNFHKSNSNSCRSLQVISKSKFEVKNNDSCLWSSWCYFMRWIVHPIRHGLPFVISFATSWISSTHVATSIHDLRINKLPCNVFCKTKQTICSFLFFFFSHQNFNNTIKFLNTIQQHN